MMKLKVLEYLKYSSSKNNFILTISFIVFADLVILFDVAILRQIFGSILIISPFLPFILLDEPYWLLFFPMNAAYNLLLYDAGSISNFRILFDIISMILWIVFTFLFAKRQSQKYLYHQRFYINRIMNSIIVKYDFVQIRKDPLLILSSIVPVLIWLLIEVGFPFLRLKKSSGL